MHRGVRMKTSIGTKLISAALSASLITCCGALVACGGSNTSGTQNSTESFASDAEAPTTATKLLIYADSKLKSKTGSSGGANAIDSVISRYQANKGRDQVSFTVKYVSSKEATKIAANGSDDGDILIANEDTMDAASEAGTVYTGSAGESIRELASISNDKLVVTRASNSSWKMPKAKTTNGKDSADGGTTQFQQLAKMNGKLALPSDATTEGKCVNRALYAAGLYSDDSGTGGSYDKSIAKKVKVFESGEKAAAAIKKGDCSAGIFLKSSVTSSYKGLEAVYTIANAPTPTYCGASLSSSENGGVARDFLQFFSQQV